MLNTLRTLIISVLIFLFICVPTANLYAQTEETVPSVSLIDKTHSGITDAIARSSQWFDNFFNTPVSDDEPVGTWVRLRGSFIQTESDGLSFVTKLKAKLDLPKLKERYQLILSSEDEDIQDVIPDDERINKEQQNQNDETTLALQYTQKRTRKFSLIHRLGVNLDDGLNPHLRTRARYTKPVANRSLLKFTQTLFWEKSEGFGEESSIEHDIPHFENMLLRATARGLFSENSNGFEWIGMLQWLMSFSNKRAIDIGGYISGETRPRNLVTEYNLFVKYRQRLLKSWLYGEIKPEIYWPRDSGFSTTTAITLTLEVQFGKP